jgi:RecA-family ATPase
MFVLAVALAVAGGGAFLDWHAPRPRKVLFVDGEMNEADLIERARFLLEASSGPFKREEAERNLVFLARQAQDPDAPFPDLSEPEGRQRIAQEAEKHGAELLILDNFSTLVECEDENSAAAFNPLIKFLMQMKQRPLAVLLVHHSNKGRKGYRGSTKIATTFETIVALKDPSPLEAAGSLSFDLEWEKHRGRADSGTQAKTVRLSADATGRHHWQFEASPLERIREMLARLRSGDFPTQKALAARLGVSEATVNRLKGEAINVHRLITRDEWDGHLRAAKDAQRDMEAVEFAPAGI